MIYQQQLPENFICRGPGKLALCTEMADSKGHSKSRHSNPIHVFMIEVEIKAQ